MTFQKGKIVSEAKDEKQESVYEMYYEFEGSSIQDCRS